MMKKGFKQRIIGLIMAVTLLTTLGVSNVYAAEVETPVNLETSANVEPRAGVEKFRLNKNYEVGSFTFTNKNTTPTKTVEGRYLYTYFKMAWTSSDKGVSTTPIRVTVEVLDAATKKNITTKYYIINPKGSVDGGFETDLKYAGRKICYRFDASSYNGPTNGYYRSARVDRFMVNTSNTEGLYFDK